MAESRPRYSWLIFDADGTLFDFERGETIALQATTDKHGVSYSIRLHDVYAAISAELWRRFENGELPLKQLRVMRFERLFTDLGRHTRPIALNGLPQTPQELGRLLKTPGIHFDSGKLQHCVYVEVTGQPLFQQIAVRPCCDG